MKNSLFLLLLLALSLPALAVEESVCTCVWEVSGDEIRFDLVGPEAQGWPGSLVVVQGASDQQIALGRWDLAAPNVVEGVVAWEVRETGMTVTVRRVPDGLQATFGGLEIESEKVEPITLPCDGRGAAVLCPEALLECAGRRVVCHDGATRCVLDLEVSAHLDHGDLICPCGD